MKGDFSRVVLIDGSGDAEKAEEFAARVLQATDGFAFGGVLHGRFEPGLAYRFYELAQARKAAHVVVIVNGKDGRHHADCAAELEAARFLSGQRAGTVDFMQVYGGDKALAMRETAESIANMPDLFNGVRMAPAYLTVPDPTAIPKALRQLAAGRSHY